MRPYAERGASAIAGCGRVCRRPRRASVGSDGWCACRMWPRVLEPSSPKSAASGSSPTPRESQTMTMARFMARILLLFEIDDRLVVQLDPHLLRRWHGGLERHVDHRPRGAVVARHRHRADGLHVAELLRDRLAG